MQSPDIKSHAESWFENTTSIIQNDFDSKLDFIIELYESEKDIDLLYFEGLSPAEAASIIIEHYEEFKDNEKAVNEHC